MSKTTIKRKKTITLPDTATSVSITFRAVNRKGKIKNANKTVIPRGAETVVVRIKKTRAKSKPTPKPAVPVAVPQLFTAKTAGLRGKNRKKDVASTVTAINGTVVRFKPVRYSVKKSKIMKH
jgi:hypothetical protein